MGDAATKSFDRNGVKEILRLRGNQPVVEAVFRSFPEASISGWPTLDIYDYYSAGGAIVDEICQANSFGRRAGACQRELALGADKQRCPLARDGKMALLVWVTSTASRVPVFCALDLPDRIVVCRGYSEIVGTNTLHR